MTSPNSSCSIKGRDLSGLLDLCVFCCFLLGFLLGSAPLSDGGSEDLRGDSDSDIVAADLCGPGREIENIRSLSLYT